MSRLTGADQTIAIKMADQWGTAEALGADDKMLVESIEENRSPENLEANPIGSGRIMSSDAQQGATTPTLSYEKLLGYNDAGWAPVVAFYGGESVTAQASGTLGYAHSIVHNETFGSRYCTYARQYVSQSVVECATFMPTRLSWRFENTPDYGRINVEGLGNDFLYEGTTNSYSTLENATTISDTELIVHTGAAEFLINGQGASALASPTDRLAITSFLLEEEKPHESAREFKGSAGNGEPIPNGDPPYSATLTITLKSADEVTFWSRARAGTEHKASFQIEGTTISGSVKKRLTIYLPRLKQIDEPSNPISSAGQNPLTVTFKCLVASSVPSGMTDRYPHPVLINTKSSTWHSDV